MSKTETGKIENAKTARVLRDDELDAVSGGSTVAFDIGGPIKMEKAIVSS